MDEDGGFPNLKGAAIGDGCWGNEVCPAAAHTRRAHAHAPPRTRARAALRPQSPMDAPCRAHACSYSAELTSEWVDLRLPPPPWDRSLVLKVITSDCLRLLLIASDCF